MQSHQSSSSSSSSSWSSSSLPSNCSTMATMQRLNKKDEAAVIELFNAMGIPSCQIDQRVQIKSKRVVGIRLSPSSTMTMTELPQALFSLSGLEELYIFGATRLLTIPPDIDRLSNLKVLSIQFCTSLEYIPPSIGTSLKKLEQFDVKVCPNLHDLECLRDAKYHWSNLKHLRVVDCQGVNLADGLEDDNEEEKNYTIHNCSSCEQTVLFPSLTSVSFRNNMIDNRGLSKIWKTFYRCNKLESIDLSYNNVTCLSYLSNELKKKHASSPSAVSHGTMLTTLRELNLFGNPILEQQQQQQLEEHITRQENYMIEILDHHPRLVSVVCCCACRSNEIQRQNHQRHSIDQKPKRPSPSSSYRNCSCFRDSAPFSPLVQHYVDLNHACGEGRERLLQATTTTIDSSTGSNCFIGGGDDFPLSCWPLVLARVKNHVKLFPCSSSPSSPDNDCQLNDISRNMIAGGEESGEYPDLALGDDDDEDYENSNQCLDDQSSLLSSPLRSTSNMHMMKDKMSTMREASTIYALLHGPAFASPYTF